MNFLYFAMLIPIFGIFYAAFTSFLKYRQHRAMLDVLKVYAEKGAAPPSEVLAALTKTYSLAEAGVTAPNPLPSGPAKVQGPLHYWSLVGLFTVFSAGFAYASWSSGTAGYPFSIVAFTMGAVAVWSLIMAVALTFKK